MNTRTRLEEIIDRMTTARNGQPVRRNADATRVPDPQLQQHTKEFDSAYGQLKDIEEAKQTFVSWADKCEIDDGCGEITDGKGLYQYFLQDARLEYHKYRLEGYERPTAFDKSTRGLAAWLNESLQTSAGGAIRIRHSPQYLSRMRRMSW